MRNNEAAIIDRQLRSAETVNETAISSSSRWPKGVNPDQTILFLQGSPGPTSINAKLRAKWLTEAGEASTAEPEEEEDTDEAR